MFPLWDIAIAPTIRAAKARRIVEIGALRGENTIQILDVLGPAGEIHVIDPVPAFDPEEHAKQFDGRYVFHQALSVDVLPTLPVMDVALIDGDHNWYTVINECQMLADVSRAAGRSMPVMILHDVLWPYGRRDLYYDPSNVPDEHKQPHAQLGMRPGRKKLLPRGGLNSVHHNAIEEGGERNGVMTGLDDFIAGYDRPVRRLVLPIYFGLAIVAEEEHLEREPELAAVFDHLESVDGQASLVELAEELRLKAMVYQHSSLAKEQERSDRAIKRLLEVTKASLLNEHYFDHERRFDYLHRQAKRKANVDPVVLRDPVHHNREAFRRAFAERSGPAGPSAAAENSFLPYTAMGRPRLNDLEACLDDVRERGLDGDLVECGTGRGGGAVFMRAYLDAYEMDAPRVWVADEFRSSNDDQQRPEMPNDGVAGFRGDLNFVRGAFERFGLLDERTQFLQGREHDVLSAAKIERIALLRIGSSASRRVGRVLRAAYDRVVDGGHVVIDLGLNRTLDDIEAFRADRGIVAPLRRIDERSVAWTRSASDGDSGSVEVDDESESVGPTSHISLVGPAPSDAVDLSVVVVFYNMKREAARTLRALSRSYQEQLGDITFEVIAVENGSSAEQRLGREFVESFGPEFRYLDMGDAARSSPIHALNCGIAAGRGEAFALMIDGAHIVTPGVYHYGLLGLRAYEPAIVCTQQWYVGPGQQGEAMDHGYDQAYEDRLFAQVRWPHTGYRLFEIGHFIGDRDWLDGMWESNCLFVTRAQLQQVGAFDEAFSMPGGGYANLELYERLGSSPDVTVVSMLGEGSFHQSHGGTTTNQPDPEERRSRVFGYGEHFASLRGRAFSGPGKRIHYIGRFSNPEARRTKPRRLSARRFAEAGFSDDDGPPTSPVPVPEELATGFVEAVWGNMPWTRTTWMGSPISTPPTDLLAYQQLIAESKPDRIVVTSTGDDDGLAGFLGDLCDLLDHGRVIVVSPSGEGAAHRRVDRVAGQLSERPTAAAVRELVDGGSVFAILGSRSSQKITVDEFVAIEPMVPVGSCVVVADTVVNGHPVWTGFGPGPAEAVKAILRRFGGFVQDSTLENYSFSFNRGGYLRRVSS